MRRLHVWSFLPKSTLLLHIARQQPSLHTQTRTHANIHTQAHTHSYKTKAHTHKHTHTSKQITQSPASLFATRNSHPPSRATAGKFFETPRNKKKLTGRNSRELVSPFKIAVDGNCATKTSASTLPKAPSGRNKLPRKRCGRGPVDAGVGCQTQQRLFFTTNATKTLLCRAMRRHRHTCRCTHLVYTDTCSMRVSW